LFQWGNKKNGKVFNHELKKRSHGIVLEEKERKTANPKRVFSLIKTSCSREGKNKPQQQERNGYPSHKKEVLGPGSKRGGGGRGILCGGREKSEKTGKGSRIICSRTVKREKRVSKKKKESQTSLVLKRGN